MGLEEGGNRRDQVWHRWSRILSPPVLLQHCLSRTKTKTAKNCGPSEVNQDKSMRHYIRKWGEFWCQRTWTPIPSLAITTYVTSPFLGLSFLVFQIREWTLKSLSGLTWSPKLAPFISHHPSSGTAYSSQAGLLMVPQILHPISWLQMFVHKPCLGFLALKNLSFKSQFRSHMCHDPPSCYMIYLQTSCLFLCIYCHSRWNKTSRTRIGLFLYP